jgi:hypothetical protein
VDDDHQGHGHDQADDDKDDEHHDS